MNNKALEYLKQTLAYLDSLEDAIANNGDVVNNAIWESFNGSTTVPWDAIDDFIKGETL